MRFEPVLAEEVVDFPRLDSLILTHRADLERSVVPRAREFAAALDLHHGIPSQRALDGLASTLTIGCWRTYRFGFDSATRELRELRRRRGDRPTLIAAAVPETPWASARYMRTLAHQAANGISSALQGYYVVVEHDVGRTALLEVKAGKLAHEVCMELVVRVLNAGRTLAALGGDTPTLLAAVAPAVYAMRSEQLDTRTCARCVTLHGTVVEVGTPAYFSLMPPNGCITNEIRGIGARCRGVYVYGDSPADFRTVTEQLRLSA